MNILALIPARGGSKGVPRKNIKPLGGFPLISYTIAAAKLSNKIDKVVVSTDSPEIRDISLKFGADVPFLRPSELSGDKAADIDYVLHALNYLKENENYIPDLIVLLRPTTPLREVKYIDEAIEKLMQNDQATSLRSSHTVAESPFKWLLLQDNFYMPICDNYTLEDTNKPRQTFPEVYVPNGYVDILRPDSIREHGSIYATKILGYITETAYEVDTMAEFEYIEYLVSKKSTSLLEYLKNI